MNVMPVAKPALAVEIPGSDWVVDFVDSGHRALLRMRDQRRQGYGAMGYRIVEPGGTGSLIPDL